MMEVGSSPMVGIPDSLEQMPEPVNPLDMTVEFDKFPTKIHHKILSNMDFHNLLKCRLVSRNLNSAVVKFAQSQKRDPSQRWNPYYPTRKTYLDTDPQKILLGLIRLSSAAAVTQFLELNGVKVQKVVQAQRKILKEETHGSTTSPAARDLGTASATRALGTASATRALVTSPATRDLGTASAARDLVTSPAARDLVTSPATRDLGTASATRDLATSPATATRDLGTFSSSPAARALGISLASGNNASSVKSVNSPQVQKNKPAPSSSIRITASNNIVHPGSSTVNSSLSTTFKCSACKINPKPSINIQNPIRSFRPSSTTFVRSSFSRTRPSSAYRPTSALIKATPSINTPVSVPTSQVTQPVIAPMKSAPPQTPVKGPVESIMSTQLPPSLNHSPNPLPPPPIDKRIIVSSSMPPPAPPSKPVTVSQTVQTFELKPEIIFPLGSVYISRHLSNHDDKDNANQHSNHSPPKATDTNQQIVLRTTQLVKNFGKFLTSFTFDDGKREHSDLSFEQLRTILSHLPSLEYLGLTAGNYEHHVEYEDIQDDQEEVEKFPSLTNLKSVELGYNTTYHLHMDILNAYGCQLRRFTCSRFGYFMRSQFGYHVSTNNTLQKLIDYVNSIRVLYPNVLSKLEELKVPIISTQCIPFEQDAIRPTPAVRWSNLKRLSLFYIHRGNEFNDCCLADLWSALHVFASTLEELCLDFQASSDFIEWVSSDSRPLAASVFQPCSKVIKFCISAVSLLRSEDMAGLVASKFPNLETLTFFNWLVYYGEAIHDNNRQGRYYNGGPTPASIPGHIGYFWKELPQLRLASVKLETWKDECVYKRKRDEMIFLSHKDTMYIY